MIPVTRPDVGEKELSEIRESFKTGWIGLGPKVEEFESEFSAKFGFDNVVATNSCTNALDLALKVANPEGTEVLVPPITWISTAFAGLYNNYEVGWVDVDPKTLNMSPKALEKRISTETAAVIPVHYGGQPADIQRIVDIAHEYNALVIEDCAHAPGARTGDDPVGGFGDIGCFSFQATKPLTTGEGGAFVTDDDDLAAEARRRSKLGVNKSTHERSEEDGYNWYYEVTDIGYKYFMNDLAAGIGLVQLERLPETRAQRNEVASTFDDAFADLDWVLPLTHKSEATHARYNYTVRVPAAHRDSFVAHLTEHDVGASVHYMPLYKHPVFDCDDTQLRVTEAVWEQLVTLPMSSTFSEEDVATVIDAVTTYGDDHQLEAPKAISPPTLVR